MRKLLFSITVCGWIGGCGIDNHADVANFCPIGGEAGCGDAHTQDLFDIPPLATLDALQNYVLSEKRDNSPFGEIKNGRGDLPDLMRGVGLVKKMHALNPIFVLALSIHESGWGTSKIARNKNNLWGWDAQDACPSECADGFPSYSRGFNYVFMRIKKNYLTADGTFYRACGNKETARCASGEIKEYDACGPTLAGMNCSYSSDDNWAQKVRSIMNKITTFIIEECAVNSSPLQV